MLEEVFYFSSRVGKKCFIAKILNNLSSIHVMQKQLWEILKLNSFVVISRCLFLLSMFSTKNEFQFYFKLFFQYNISNLL